MGWNGSLDASCAIGDAITFTPDTSAEGGYTVSSFTAPKKGVYRFQLYGSGGAAGTMVIGGKGGYTDGYLLLEKGQTVYVGAGGLSSAAFVSGGYGASLAAASTPLLIAGGGGGAGTIDVHADYTQWGSGGANGGGTTGANAANGGKGGTQSAGGQPGGAYTEKGNAGSYGTGGEGVYTTALGTYAKGGRGGDGYYGGGSGYSVASHNSGTDATSSYAYDGGGGSGYVRTASITVINRTYVSTTTQGAGSGAGENGRAMVTYYARALLPVIFNGVQLERLFINGTEAESLYYDGTLVYARAARKVWRWLTCLAYRAIGCGSRRAIQGC